MHMCCSKEKSLSYSMILSASWFARHGQINLLIYHLSLMYFDFQKDISGKAIT